MKCPRLITAMAACFLFASASAQLNVKLPSLKSSSASTPISTSFRNDIQKVVEEHPHQYARLRGEVVNKNPQSVEYVSLVRPEGSLDASVIQYSSFGKEVYTWQTTLLVTEDFEEASKKYKWLYHQLKGMNIKYVADLYTLRGEFEEPDESLGFATSTLAPAHPPTPLAKLRIEVQLNFEFPEWKVSLLVFEKEREDDEPGDIIGGGF